MIGCAPPSCTSASTALDAPGPQVAIQAEHAEHRIDVRRYDLGGDLVGRIASHHDTVAWRDGDDRCARPVEGHADPVADRGWAGEARRSEGGGGAVGQQLAAVLDPHGVEAAGHDDDPTEQTALGSLLGGELLDLGVGHGCSIHPTASRRT